MGFGEFVGQVLFGQRGPSAKNQVLKMLPEGGINNSGKQFCRILVSAGANFIALRRRRCHCEVHVACRDGMYSYQKRKQFTAGTI